MTMEHKCEVSDIIINGDEDNRLYNIITDYCEHDTIKAITIASFINNSDSDFGKHLSKSTGTKVDNIAKFLLEKTDDDIISTINNYYNKKHKKIKSIKSLVTIDNLDYFLTIEAKNLAYEHTANLIKDTYTQKLLSTNKRPTKKELFNEVSKQITTEFIKRVTKYKNIAKSENKHTDLIKEIEELESKCTELRDKVLNTSLPVEERIEYRKQFDIAREDLFDKRMDLSELAKTDDTRLYNYSNLYNKATADSDAFYKEVLKRKELTDLVRIYNNDKIDNYEESESLEDDSNFNVSGGESIDEFAKSWSDKEKSSFLEDLSSDIKIYLDSLYHASSTPLDGSDTITYNTDNELGIPRKMGYGFIVSQLLGNCSFTSVDNFLNEISKLSENSELHGLYKIYIDGKKNKQFANKLFQELAKVPVNKIIVNVNGKTSEVVHSNKAIDKKTTTIEQIVTNIRNLTSNLLFAEDLKKLSSIENAINRLQRSNIIATEQLIKFNSQISNYIPTITKILKRIIPDITETSIQNFINNNKEKCEESSFNIK